MSELILYLQVQILDTKLFRIRVRVRITEPESSLDTGHKYPDLKSRSNDRTENESWTQRSLEKVELNSEVPDQESRHKVGLKSRRLRTRINPKTSSESLIEEGSVRGRSLQSSSSTGSTRNQDQLQFVNEPGFIKSQYFKSDNR